MKSVVDTIFCHQTRISNSEKSVVQVTRVLCNKWNLTIYSWRWVWRIINVHPIKRYHFFCFWFWIRKLKNHLSGLFKTNYVPILLPSPLNFISTVSGKKIKAQKWPTRFKIYNIIYEYKKFLKSHKRGQIWWLELFFSGHQDKSNAQHSTKSKFGKWTYEPTFLPWKRTRVIWNLWSHQISCLSD